MFSLTPHNKNPVHATEALLKESKVRVIASRQRKILEPSCFSYRVKYQRY